MGNSKKMTRNLFRFAKCTTLLFVVYLLSSCSTIQLAERYQGMVVPVGSGERIIDRVLILRANQCTDDTRRNHPPMRLGGDATVIGDGRHPHEVGLRSLMAEAQRRFPNEQIAVRDARRYHFHNNHRREGQGQTTWIAFDCHLRYIAYVVTAEPMPAPVTHSETITVTEGQVGNIVASDGSVLGQISFAQVTRGDLYRRAHNWLTDANPRGTVEIVSAQFDLGRITGRYVFTIANGGITYSISSFFTIDVHDARAQIRFENTVLRRGGAPEPIFLQSFANIAHAELVTFTDALISRITSPDW